jgi:hypothetical protein
MKIEKLNVDFGAMERMKEQMDSAMKGAKEFSGKVSTQVEAKIKSPVIDAENFIQEKQELAETQFNRAKEILEDPDSTYNTSNKAVAADAKGLLDTAAEILRSKLQRS